MNPRLKALQERLKEANAIEEELEAIERVLALPYFYVVLRADSMSPSLLTETILKKVIKQGLEQSRNELTHQLERLLNQRDDLDT